MSLPNILPSDLEDLALEMGAKVTRPDGSVFNARGRSGVIRLPESKPAALVPQGAPAPPVGGEDILAKVVELLSRPAPVQEQPAPVIHVPPTQVVVQPQQRVLDWTFTFERDTTGAIKSIRAKAT